MRSGASGKCSICSCMQRVESPFTIAAQIETRLNDPKENTCAGSAVAWFAGDAPIDATKWAHSMYRVSVSDALNCVAPNKAEEDVGCSASCRRASGSREANSCIKCCERSECAADGTDANTNWSVRSARYSHSNATWKAVGCGSLRGKSRMKKKF